MYDAKNKKTRIDQAFRLEIKIQAKYSYAEKRTN